jgi:diguanylate cyclase (GGDEF)-like protein
MTSILVLDDQATVRSVVGAVLREAGYGVLEAEDGPEALRVAAEHHPDAVIADMLMPSMDGYHFLRELRGLNGVGRTPVVFYTGTYEVSELLDVARDWGRVWVLTKPAAPEAILGAISQAITSPGAEAPTNGVPPEADARYAQLVHRKLFDAATEAITDPLTGLPNRRALTDTLERLLAGARRHNRAIGVVMLDIDRFKTVNDTHGHEAGDLVLTRVGDLLKEVSRESDFMGRYGGEEFLVLMPETPVAGLRVVAERLRSGVAALDCGVPGGVTASFGCAGFPGHGDDPNSLLRAADAALYEAKAQGRDRVEVARLLR